MVVVLAIAIKAMNDSIVSSARNDIPPAPQVNKLTALWDAIMLHAETVRLGQADTPYSLVEFADFQCAPCGRMEPYLYRFVTDNPTQVNLYFVHRPVPTMHRWAIGAAEAAEIAASKGKFWPMYRVLYANQNHLDPRSLPSYAVEAGVDRTYFINALTSHAYQPKVFEAMRFSDGIGVESTPTIIVRDNRASHYQVLSGDDTIERFFKSPPWNLSTHMTTKNGKVTAAAVP